MHTSANFSNVILLFSHLFSSKFQNVSRRLNHKLSIFFNEFQCFFLCIMAFNSSILYSQFKGTHLPCVQISLFHPSKSERELQC